MAATSLIYLRGIESPGYNFPPLCINESCLSLPLVIIQFVVLLNAFSGGMLAGIHYEGKRTEKSRKKPSSHSFF
jgi:hypothetical protein